jgi:hypothetical protein
MLIVTEKKHFSNKFSAKELDPTHLTEKLSEKICHPTQLTENLCETSHISFLPHLTIHRTHTFHNYLDHIRTFPTNNNNHNQSIKQHGSQQQENKWQVQEVSSCEEDDCSIQEHNFQISSAPKA